MIKRNKNQVFIDSHRVKSTKKGVSKKDRKEIIGLVNQCIKNRDLKPMQKIFGYLNRKDFREIISEYGLEKKFSNIKNFRREFNYLNHNDFAPTPEAIPESIIDEELETYFD